MACSACASCSERFACYRAYCKDAFSCTIQRDHDILAEVIKLLKRIQRHGCISPFHVWFVSRAKHFDVALLIYATACLQPSSWPLFCSSRFQYLTSQLPTIGFHTHVARRCPLTALCSPRRKEPTGILCVACSLHKPF